MGCLFVRWPGVLCAGGLVSNLAVLALNFQAGKSVSVDLSGTRANTSDPKGFRASPYDELP